MKNSTLTATTTTTIFVILLFLHSSLALKEGQICLVDKNCDSGFHCETCVANGNLMLRGTRTQPINPT
ncbi:unnamed protein product [Lathyrus oleraceus]